MDDIKREKIKRFVNDKVMFDSVFGLLQEVFLKARPNKDVHYLAAKCLAIEFLDESKPELMKYKEDEAPSEKVSVQVGL